MVAFFTPLLAEPGYGLPRFEHLAFVSIPGDYLLHHQDSADRLANLTEIGAAGRSIQPAYQRRSRLVRLQRRTVGGVRGDIPAGVRALAAVVRPGIDGNSHFDIAYYTAILSFLWIHYYHDHFLFTDFEALDGAHG